MNMDVITVQDCIDMHEKKGQATVINDGIVLGFEEE